MARRTDGLVVLLCGRGSKQKRGKKKLLVLLLRARLHTTSLSIIHSSRPLVLSSCWCWWSFEIDHIVQCDLHGLKGTRRSRTRARSESSTSTTHRPPIESSSSSTLLA